MFKPKYCIRLDSSRYRHEGALLIVIDYILYDQLKKKSYIGPIKGGAIGFIKGHDLLWKNAGMDVHLIYQVPLTPFFWIGGIFYGVCNIVGGYLNEETILPLASKHRIKWLRDTVIRENIQIEYQVSTIKLRIETLQQELEKLDEGFTQEEFVEEMSLLDRLLTVLSPTTSFKINDMSIAKFLEKYTPPKDEDE